MPPTRTLRTPVQVAAEARRRLRQQADPRVARQAASYFKKHDVFAVHGVKAATVRAIARDLHALVADRWGVREALTCCEILSREQQHESKAVGVLLLGRYRRHLPPTTLRTVRAWILEGRFANWAGIDLVCPELVTPVVERSPELGRRVVQWSRHRNLWLRRGAAVTFVPLARKGCQLDEAYAVVEQLVPDREDLIHKASGWLLREAGKADRGRLERFLLARGPSMTRTAVRYAIERFSAADRRRLLAATRAP